MPRPEPIKPRPAASGGTELPKRQKELNIVSDGPYKPENLPSVKVQGAFGRVGRLRNPVDYSTVTNPKFLSRAARERIHVSHS